MLLSNVSYSVGPVYGGASVLILLLSVTVSFD